MAIRRPINFSDPTQWAVLFDELRQLKGIYEVAVTRKRRKATLEQFGYYFGVVLPLAKQWLNDTQGGPDAESEYTEAETDVWLKCHFLGTPVIDKATGEQMSVIAPSKATFNTRQMAEFVDDVIRLLTSFKVPVPPPDKNYREARAMALAGTA
jgi:hypothetical protein